MNNYCLRSTLLLLVVSLLVPGHAIAEDIRLAVASNFAGAMKAIVHAFETEAEHTVKLSFGSTGKHYAQIKNGAPFDAFFAADTRRPELLEQEGFAIGGTRFTYAIGRLALWSPRAGYVDVDGNVLEARNFRFLAIANPRLAPYGEAAREVLQARGSWDGLSDRLVRGENVSQAFQFVASGNAELGFVAYSQVAQLDMSVEGSMWEVPRDLYSPIEQQAVLLTDNAAAREFLRFVRGGEASNIIRAHGYDTSN